jgi:hypothetical protein
VANAALLFDPDDEDGLVRAIESALHQAAPDPGAVRALALPAAAERFHAGVTRLLR